MTYVRLIGAGVLLLAGGVAYADPCKVTIESNDVMQFSAHEIAVPTDCAAVMGHDWVLAKEADVSAIVDAGRAAGPTHGYLPQNDKRIIAATKVVGGGESTTLQFSTAGLVHGERYAFFCTTPGHASVMHGKFLFGGATRMAQAGR